MIDKLKKSNYPYAVLYMITTLICITVMILAISLKGGSLLRKYLFVDHTDTGNDFFACIPAAQGFCYGYGQLALYPPLAKLFFVFIAHIYSYNNIPLNDAWRGSPQDPRLEQVAVIPYLFLILFATLIIVFVISRLFRKDEKAFFIAMAIMCSYSIWYTLDRGNILYLAFMFIMIYIAYYRSENKVLKELSLISLAFSFGLKLYPAAFGILLIYEKRWKDAVRAIIYGMTVLVIPYLILEEVLPQNSFINTLRSVYRHAKRLYKGLFVDSPIYMQIFLICAALLFILGIWEGFKSKKTWLNAYYAGVFALIGGAQFEYAYTYVFLIPALVLFLKDEQKITIKNTIYFVLLAVLALPLPVFVRMTKHPLIVLLKMYVLFASIIIFILIEWLEKFIRKKQRA